MAKKISEAQLVVSGKDNTKTAFNSVQGRLKRMKDGLLSVKGVMAGVTVAGFAAMGKRALDTADAIGKFSDRAGISTKSLQEMHHAFDLAGVSNDAVNQSMIVFGKRLGKARDGIGALAGGLKKGQSQLLANLEATKSNEEALQLVFKAMGNAKDQAEKLAIADAAFGGAGLKMTAAFNDGTLAFEAAKKEANDLGMVMTESGVRSAEKLNDMFTRLGGSISGQLNQSFLELAPLLLEHKDSFIKMAKVIGETLVGAVKIAIPVIQTIAEGFKLAGSGIAAVATGVDSAITGLERLATEGKAFVDLFVEGFETQWNKVKDKVGSLIPGWMRKYLEQKSPAELGSLDSKKWGGQVPILFAEGIEENLPSVQNAAKNMGDSMSENIGGAVNNLTADFGSFADGVFSSMQRGESALDSFRNAAVSSLQEVQNEMLRTAVFDPIKRAGSSLLSGIGKTIGSAIGGSFFGGGSGGGDMYDYEFAGGGFLPSGKTALVGERGAELFRPNSGGMVVPNNQLGGGGVSVTLNLSTGVQSTVRAEVMGMMPMISANVKNAVAEARQRGGAFSEAMGG